MFFYRFFALSDESCQSLRYLQVLPSLLSRDTRRRIKGQHTSKQAVCKRAPKPSPQQFQPIPDISYSFNLWKREETKLNANPDIQQLLQAAYQAPSAELGEELQSIRMWPTSGSDGLFQHRAVPLEKEK
ncbi:hypothetical protein PENSUB_3719 [Penicillium subrubescens]|uniref:Uncharacterized protein n=1 Tax=Penicillium subrubescens TaxID=1316194 RepID=A0A1Q5UEK2_9EURO|nr:hypothetical protein PENSUB_3719 [Penicillium subrubescens]